MATELTVVKFISHYSPYVKGDIAGFSKKVADNLIEHEKAVAYKAPAGTKTQKVDTKDGTPTATK
jgi:hypothetical protein